MEKQNNNKTGKKIELFAKTSRSGERRLKRGRKFAESNIYNFESNSRTN